MPTWEANQLLLFLAFFIPGFVSIKIWELLVPSQRRDFSSSLAEAVGFSALNFAVLLPLIVSSLTEGSYLSTPWARFAVFYIAFVVAPISWPFLLVRALRSNWAASYFVNPVRKPWDKLFGQRETLWVIIHLTDGSRVGGYFGERSHASVYPAEEQLYVEAVWKLSEKNEFIEKVPSSRGMLVSAKDIRAIEFFK